MPDKKKNAEAPQADFEAGVTPSEPVEPLPGNTQEPPPLDPALGAASPPSPTGNPVEPDVKSEPEPNPLANSNVPQG